MCSSYQKILSLATSFRTIQGDIEESIENVGNATAKALLALPTYDPRISIRKVNVSLFAARQVLHSLAENKTWMPESTCMARCAASVWSSWLVGVMPNLQQKFGKTRT